MKIFTPLAFSAVVPISGFRWVSRAPDGEWSAAEPPADWPEQDYEASYAEAGENYGSADRFFLAAPASLSLPDEQSDRKIIYAPDLYLDFASRRATPTTILELATRFGFLGMHGDPLAGDYVDVSEPNRIFDQDTELRVESGSRWLAEFASTRSILDEWTNLQQRGDRSEIAAFIEDRYRYPMGGELGFQIRIDAETGEMESQVIATTLSSFLEIQIGMAIAAVPGHRKCGSCTKWFPVFPAEGRPEKLYCSDACRMRAYRKRKSSREAVM